MAKNQNERIIKIRLKNSDSFRKWQRLKAASKALELKLDDLARQAGLPIAKQFRKDCKGYLVDGNNNAIAKFSSYAMPERTIPPCRALRIT